MIDWSDHRTVDDEGISVTDFDFFQDDDEAIWASEQEIRIRCDQELNAMWNDWWNN